MKQWDVYTSRFPHGEHPAVILTPDAWLHLETVDILACTTNEIPRGPEIHEVLLDEEDGLDWPTLCRCHRNWVAPKPVLVQRRGSVTTERRRQIGRKLIRVLGLYLD
jgi:mRNA-degrading endonuclease toxin of MazEF toxin-antitoxin module